jgi:hypothetical protein
MNKLYRVLEVRETGHENGSVMRCSNHRKGEHMVGGIHHPPDGQPNWEKFRLEER